MADVFVSYAEEDARLAAAIAGWLAAEGLGTWRYEADAVGGGNYLLETRAQIERCGAFLLLLTPAALESEQIDREVVRAHECGKPILPVLSGLLYDDFARRRPAWQQAIGAATAVSLTAGAVEAARARLVQGARTLLGRPAPAAAPAPPPGFLGRAARRLRSRAGRRLALAALLLLGLGALARAWIAEAQATREREAAARAREAAAVARDAALKLLDAGRPVDAEPLLDRALVLAPEETETQRLLGRMWGARGEPARALAALDARLAAAPGDGLARYYRGLALRDLNRGAEAVAEWTAALAGGGLGEEHVVLASYHRGLLQLDRHEPAHPVRVSLSEAARRDVTEAERDLDFVVGQRGWLDALIERGRARTWLGRDEDARRDLAQAYRRAADAGSAEDGAAAEAAHLLGLLDFRAAEQGGRQADVSRAIQSFDVALGHRPDEWRFRVARALGRAAAGFLPEGLAELEATLAALPPDAAGREALGAVIEEVRASAAALPVQDLVLEAERVDGPEAPEGPGLLFRARARIAGRAGVPCHFRLWVYEGEHSPYPHTWRPVRARDPRYAAPDGTLVLNATVVPGQERVEVPEVRLYLPYAQTPSYEGWQRYEFHFGVLDPGGLVSRRIEGHFSFTKSGR